jgi:membrane protein DedA with SNARE-associated domain
VLCALDAGMLVTLLSVLDSLSIALSGALGGDLLDRALAALSRYGYLAVFVFAFAETSLLFPFLPSEAVIPGAAAVLVTDPLSGLAFSLATAGGATSGSLFCYQVFGTGSARLADRFGDRVRVSESEVDRAVGWFRRWGESSVLWGRFLPGLRSLISIPAGFAGMNRGKFALYSGAGSGLFAAAVAGLVLYGFDGRPYAVLGGWVAAAPGRFLAVARSAPVLLVVACLLGLFGLLLARNVYAERYR